MRKLFLTSMAVATVVCAAQVQARTVKGVVIDAGTGEAIIGATVMPIGGGQGAATDFDGKFTLNVPDNVKTARVSSVGYKEKVVNLSADMRIELADASTNLDDVVVVAYGTATKESLTGSVSVIGSKEIEDRPVTSVTAALEGNAPGVQVNSTTGAPGSSPSIVIRGIGTINGVATPQYVVDGMIFNGDLSDLNPSDIESMTVLKDAASCALYGVRASNGVVLITTKKAKQAGHTEVTLSIREGMYTRGLPEYNRLSTDQWMEAMFSTAANQLMSGQPQNYPDRATANAFLQQYFVDNQLQGQNVYNMPGNELFDAEGKLVAGAHVLPGYTDLDWWDAVSRTGMRQEYNLNIASAGEKYNMFASVAYLNEKGYMLKTDFERFNGRFNVNIMPTSYLKAGVNMNASYQTSQAQSSAGTANSANPFSTQFYAPIFPYYAHDENGDIIYENGKPQWNMRGRNDNRNVAFELRNDFTEYTGSTIDANAYATAVIPYGFELSIRGNLNRTYGTGKRYQNRILGDAAPYGTLQTASSQDRYHTFMQQLTWNHDYGNDMHMHHIDVFMGHENTSVYQETVGTMMREQMEDGYYANDNFLDILSNPSGSIGEGRTESYLARARYNFDQKYFAEASVRRDGADRFSKENRWGTFWSVGGSWVISKENFMHNIDWVNYLKFRASYGVVGNYLSAPALSWSSQYVRISNVSNTAMLVRATIGNPDLVWEGQRTLDLGLEGSLFNNRLNFSIGYFDKTSNDLIFKTRTASSLGFVLGNGAALTTPYNIGKVANRGWELSFNGTVMRTNDFQWTASIDATFMQSRILTLPFNNQDYANGIQRLSVGRSMYSWYMPTFVGVDQMTGKSLYAFEESEYRYHYKDAMSEEQLQANWAQQVESAQAAGELVEINGKQYTTSSTYATNAWHGNAIPTVYGSFGSQFSWKGINFGFLFTYSLGGKVLDSDYQSLMSVSSYNSNYHVDVLKAWTGVPEGMTADSPNRIDPNGIPQNNAAMAQANNMTSSRFLTNASWLVLKNINISYDLPKSWSNRLQLQNINIGFTADNLFTVAARKGLNPQKTFSGYDSASGASFVTSRVFSFQLTARF